LLPTDSATTTDTGAADLTDDGGVAGAHALAQPAATLPRPLFELFEVRELGRDVRRHRGFVDGLDAGLPLVSHASILTSPNAVDLGMVGAASACRADHLKINAG
jgi:hypothetical protein